MFSNNVLQVVQSERETRERKRVIASEYVIRVSDFFANRTSRYLPQMAWGLSGLANHSNHQ